MSLARALSSLRWRALEQRPQGSVEASSARLNAILWAIFLVGAAALTLQRLWLIDQAPLWLDESWTGAIVSTNDWGEFGREVYLDVNAPLYYLIAHLWQKLAGLSDFALRLPSLLFVTAAGLAPLLWRSPGLSRQASLLWAALLLSWWPGIAMSIDARAYALLLLVSTLQTIAFVRLLHDPGRRPAALWCGLACLAILTHYFSLFPAAVQCLIFLGRYRRVALRVWPVALLFLPALIWLGIHLPRLAEYARPDVAWYDLIGWASLLPYLRFAIGQSTPLFAPAILLVIVLATYWPGARRDEPLEVRSHLWLAVGAGLVTLVLLLAMGAVRPMLIHRYLTPLVPSVLLGIVMAAHETKRAHLAFAALAALFVTASLKPAIHAAEARFLSGFGLSRASAHLLEADSDRIVFAFDVGAMAVLEPSSVSRLGGFLLHRAGSRAEVHVVRLGAVADPSRLLLQQAVGERPAILWFYNPGDRAVARRNPPRIAELAPDWACQDEAHGEVRILACAPRRLFSR